MPKGMPMIDTKQAMAEATLDGNSTAKAENDAALARMRASGLTAFHELTEAERAAWIAALAHAHTGSKALCRGSYRNVLVQPKQLIFERYADGERVLVAINADGNPFDAHFDAGCGRAVDLITGADHDFGGGSTLEPYSCHFWKCER